MAADVAVLEAEAEAAIMAVGVAATSLGVVVVLKAVASDGASAFSCDAGRTGADIFAPHVLS